MSTLGYEMRHAMGHFATGVTVITSRDGVGRTVGTTVNAFSSVSLEPRLLLVCLDRESQTLAALRGSGRFAVNILGEHQRDHSNRFAARGEEARAHEVEFDFDEHGVPRLSDSLATVACRVDAIHPAGDHEIVVGEALAIDVADGGVPLLFFRGTYSALEPQAELGLESAEPVSAA